jgi:hypothetical protein
MEYDENDDRHQMLEIFKNLSNSDPSIYKGKQKINSIFSNNFYSSLRKEETQNLK